VTSLPPHAVAGIDQELAGLDADLDYMVAAFRQVSTDHGETQTLADLAVTINAHYDAMTRSELLAAAVRRLARQEPTA
jgi:hypothetical protein